MLIDIRDATKYYSIDPVNYFPINDCLVYYMQDNEKCQ